MYLVIRGNRDIIMHMPKDFDTNRLSTLLLLVLVIAFFSGVVFAGSLPLADTQETSRYLGQDSAVKLDVVGMDGRELWNSVTFAQIPNHWDYFLGRILDNADPTRSPGPKQYYALALFKMDWSRHKLRMIKYLFRPLSTITKPFTTNNSHTSEPIRTAYDPTVQAYDNEYWVAFECGGMPWPLGASSCVGPLNMNDGIDNASLDPSRVSVVVSGTDADPASGFRHSASVPKLLNFNHRGYLYWSAIAIDKKGTWMHISVRGMEIGQNPTTRLFWGKDKDGSTVRLLDRTIASYDPVHNDEVLSTGSDDASDSAADIQGIFYREGIIYLTAALGGTNEQKICLAPRAGNRGCFRLQIYRSSAPLGNNIFNRSRLIGPALIPNPNNYSQFAYGPSGELLLIGEYFTNIAADLHEMWLYPVAPETLRFSQ
jgi:hypothetical protein